MYESVSYHSDVGNSEKFKHPKCLIVGNWFDKICYTCVIECIDFKGHRYVRKVFSLSY